MSSKQSNRQYRSRDGDDIRVVTSTGHVAIVGAEYRKLPPIYHNAAIAAGCECDAPTIVRNDAKVENGPKNETPVDIAALIERALKTMIERDNAGDFNHNNGEPNVKPVKDLVGMNVKRAQITPVWVRLQEEAAKDDDDAGDGEED